MESLKLPDAFEGDWENLLIMTYGADIRFFENFIWRELPKRCSNKIILADGKHYLDAYAEYAERGMIRFLNQRFVFDGIFIPYSAHAKLILLTNHEKGRLLIGSGNLGLEGYASGGELFTLYEYSSKEKGNLPSFLSTWDFIQELINRKYIGQSALPYIEHLHAQTPWLFHASKAGPGQIIHNLSRNVLSQLVGVVNGETVEELWIHSPFFDEKAFALQQMLGILKPNKVHILIQENSTSIDPKALDDVLNKFSGKSQVYFVRLGMFSRTYIHAKLFLIKTSKRAICMQGSPNLSQVAMLLSPPLGNIELANLSIGNRNDYDYLFENLIIAPIEEPISNLRVAFVRPEPHEDYFSAGWLLIGGDWQENRLTLRFQGEIPNLLAHQIKIDTYLYPLEILDQRENSVVILLSDDAKTLLSLPVPISLVCQENNQESNPVYICNTASLNREINISEEEPQLEGFKELNLDDDQFERLLSELESALVIDRRSMWQMVGRITPKTTEDNDDALRLDYADIDYEQLRNHPKIRHYVEGKTSSGNSGSKSRLQLILTAINDHFNGLVNLATGRSNTNLISITIADDDNGDQTEDEKEKNEADKQKQQKSSKARIRTILKNFIKRYIRGIQSRDFQEAAGFDVMARNYIIFSHLLWRLYAKDWVEPEFIMDSFLQIWHFFWGDKKQVGYYSTLSESEQQQVDALLKEHRSNSLLLAAFYYGAYLSHPMDWNDSSTWENIRLGLRNFLRDYLKKFFVVIDGQVIEDAWFYVGGLFPVNTPSPSRIIGELSQLANYENQTGFLRSIEVEFGYTEGSCFIEKQSIYREHLNTSAQIDCLVIRDVDAIASIDDAFLIVRLWEKFNRRDYYRIITVNKSRIFYYDERAKYGMYYQSDTEDFNSFQELPRNLLNDWENRLQEIGICAKDVDNTLSIKVSMPIER